ncbi:MAG: hypothetical protein JSV78_11675 [Phycisphaerales bacterium]|nr:MAG: hypothetical protein JSV78_11675 [Phycisphaerales bacterium]
MSRQQTPPGQTRTKRGAVQPVDLPLILAIAVLLLAAAVIANMTAFDRAKWPGHLLQSLIWLVTIAVLLFDAWSRRQIEALAAARTRDVSHRSMASFLLRAHTERTIVLSLAVVALFSVASHYHFGKFHCEGRFLHDHEFYHYYMGSKYFPELGYHGLYTATHRALIENDSTLSGAIPVVKNLRTYQREGHTISLERSNSVTRLFSDRRWQEFKQDVRFFQARISASGWQYLLVDHGFNGTPFWTRLGSTFSGHLELNNRTLFLLASFDLLFIAAMLLLVGYAFGLKTSLLFCIFFFANFFATFDVTGGSFLRQLWLASLVGFVCFFKKGKMGPAGFCLAVSVLDRVFPLLFALLPVVLFVRESVRRRSLRHGQTRFLVSFLCFTALLGGWSATATGGVTTWKNWYNNISAHNRWFYINQISMRNLFIVNPATIREITAEGWDEALWQREREQLNAQSRYTLQAVRVVLLVLLIALMAREKEPEISLGLLSFTPFILFNPGNYYCVFLAILVICWQKSFGLALTVLAMQIFFWLLCIPFSTPMELELRHWIVSLCLALAFAAFLSVALLRNAQGQPGFTKTCRAILVASGLLLAGAIAADVHAARAARDWMAFDAIPRDVRSLCGATVHLEQMAEWGSGWSRNDHLVFMAEAPGAQGTISVPARRTGSYKVKIDYSTAPPFGVIRLSVNGKAQRELVNLFSPRVGIRYVLYEKIQLKEGSNDFTFTVEGKDPASAYYHFAIDRILVEAEAAQGAPVDAPAAREARLEALDKAVSWVLAHPADAFDGGRNSVYAEIQTLYHLSTNPHLTDRRAIYSKEIEKRFSRLNARRAYRTRPEEYEMLVVAAYIAQKLELDLDAFDSVADGVQQWAASFYRDGSGLQSLFLCEYLHRVKPAVEVPCNINRSILHREYSERKLLELLAGDVDRTKAPTVFVPLSAIARDVCALTDFGNEPPPQTDELADKAFWAQLCEGGIRWGRETGDLVTVARLILAAKCLEVESLVPSFQAAVDFLVQHQEPDGSFGPTNPRSPNPYREGVLATIMAIASSL